ncbi:MAG TPA: peptidase MA family metallohydrolase [Ktedonobacteraceae bacterium]|nr:peptidase MA family metallohydrolase [Ktedonobacteraceae bacterium]
MLLRRFHISLFIALVFVPFLLSHLVSPGNVHGLTFSTKPITVTSRTYVEHFPDYIDLEASAQDTAGTINQANIVLTFIPDGASETHPVPLSKKGNVFVGSWHEDTSHGHFIPPGVQVNYYWEFKDNKGNTFTDAQQQFTTVDNRFTWQHLTQGMLQVNWYNRSSNFGQYLLETASASIQKISDTLGGSLNQPTNLWIYASDRDFHGSLAPGSYEWVGGEALPLLHEASIVVMDRSDDTLIRDMPHESTHLVFHELTSQGITAPTWFDEGLAVYNQAFRESQLQARWDKGLASHSLLRLSQISDTFPANADQAYLAYAQSYYLLDYMYHTFGKPGMVQLIKLMNNPQNTFDQDLTQALGVDEIHLENQWRLSNGQSAVLITNVVTPTPQPVIKIKHAQNISTNYTTFWLLIGLGIFLVFVSLISLIVLITHSLRYTKVLKEQANFPNQVNSPHGNQAYPFQYSDPSPYMRTSIYTQPSSQPASPYQGSEYPIHIPGEQAPQE